MQQILAGTYLKAVSLAVIGSRFIDEDDDGSVIVNVIPPSLSGTSWTVEQLKHQYPQLAERTKAWISGRKPGISQPVRSLAPFWRQVKHPSTVRDGGYEVRSNMFFEPGDVQVLQMGANANFVINLNAIGERRGRGTFLDFNAIESGLKLIRTWARSNGVSHVRFARPSLQIDDDAWSLIEEFLLEQLITHGISVSILAE